MRALPLLLLLAGLSACSQTIERACGRDGEGCCGGACDDGLACVDDRCAPCPPGGCDGCGVAGAACCATGPACEEGLRCDGTACIARCGDGCEPRQRSCSEAGLPQLCLVEEGEARCTSWEALDACGDAEVCREGSCTDACETVCAPDELACGSDGPLTCRIDPVTACPEWTPIELPDGDTACIAGACADLFCWENPLPAGGMIFSYYADEFGAQTAIDAHGNTILGLLETWQYDFRARDGLAEKMIQLSACSSLTRAKGISRDSLYQRGLGGFTRQPLPPVDLPLTAIECLSEGRWAIAGGDDASVVLVHDDEQFAFDVPGVGRLERLVLDPIGDALYAIGVNVPGVIRCAIQHSPLRTDCRLEDPDRIGGSFSLAGIRADGVLVVTSARGVVFSRRGGAWQQEGSVAGSPTALALAEDGTMWVGTNEGRVARSSGGTFSQLPAFTTAPIVGLGVVGTDVLVADRDFLVFRLDATERTEPAELTTRALSTADLHAVAGAQPEDLYVVGAGGTILHRRGALWQREAIGLTNVDLNALAFVSSNEVYAFGEGGTILARRDGVWRREASALTTQRLTAAFTDGERVWAGGGGGILIERPVGPSPDAWEIVRRAEPGGQELSSLTGYASTGVGGADEVIGVDWSCNLTRRTPQGVFLDEIPDCVDPPMLATFDESGDLWLAGGIAPTTVYRRSAGRFTYELLSSDAPQALFSRGPDVWLVGLGGDLYVHQSAQWRLQSAGLPVPTGGGTVTASGDMFLVGRSGQIWHRH